MNFRIGQKVVCVDDNWSCYAQFQLRNCPARPAKGTVYTIRGLHYCIDNKQTILLEELVNPIVEWRSPWGSLEPGFFIGRFRPLVEKKTDISSLVALLNPVNHKQLEDVN